MLRRFPKKAYFVYLENSKRGISNGPSCVFQSLVNVSASRGFEFPCRKIRTELEAANEAVAISLSFLAVVFWVQRGEKAHYREKLPHHLDICQQQCFDQQETLGQSVVIVLVVVLWQLASVIGPNSNLLVSHYRYSFNSTRIIKAF